MRAELFLARRYLRPKRNEISIITIISIIGVMLGVAVLIVVLAVMTGFGNEMRSKMLQTQPHLDIVTLSPAGGVIATTNTAPVKQKIPVNEGSRRNSSAAFTFAMRRKNTEKPPEYKTPVPLCVPRKERKNCIYSRIKV